MIPRNSPVLDNDCVPLILGDELDETDGVGSGEALVEVDIVALSELLSDAVLDMLLLELVLTDTDSVAKSFSCE